MSYLTTMVGNMTVTELSQLLHFVTTVTACVVPKIRVEFNVDTCDCVLELPTSYVNYNLLKLLVRVLCGKWDAI